MDAKALFGNFMKDTILLELLRNVLSLDASFITQMEQVGFITPAIIVNRFGLNIWDIAQAFSMMGASHILNTQSEVPTMQLVMF